MLYRSLFILFLIAAGFAHAQQAPDKIYGELFEDVQMSGIFPDSKTFVDCIPKKDPKEIVKEYLSIKNNPAIRFSLELFIRENFIIPEVQSALYSSKGKTLKEHLNELWPMLQRRADTFHPGSSLLPLPNEYIIPGGRFREIYYWDSYFTMLGLKESKHYGLIENMVKNFAYLINEYGHVPNGNRTYYLSRSQPPFFSLMLELLAEIKGPQVFVIYQPALLKEYAYWMDQSAKTSHLVSLKNGLALNRYWDQLDIPRQESYKEDKTLVEARKLYPEHEQKLYRDLRSAAESGWDFSSRWFSDGKKLSSIETTNILPVDLNCLLYHLETTIERSYLESGNHLRATLYNELAARRKKAIRQYCWSPQLNWYVDYNTRTRTKSNQPTLAGMFPFFLGIADSLQATRILPLLEKKFLKKGGLVTTLVHTGQQWDAPNGWAPLQWIAVKGLENFGQKNMAEKIATRWFKLNKKVFESTGKMMEKYDVVNTSREAGGGEYPSQDGFGWTNGVLLALMALYNLN